MIRKSLVSTALAAGLMLTTPALGDDDAFQTFKVLKPEVALELASAALADCRKRGYQVAVAVVDRFGVTQVMLRDRFAGPHTPSTAARKGWTSVSFRTNTGEVAKLTLDDPQFVGLRGISQALLLGGGVVIDAGGVMVGGVGVSGAPSPAEDEACAVAGIEAIEDKIAF